MAIKALNSVGGFSVGETPVTIVYANGDITTLNLSANANVLFNGPNVTVGQVANLHILGGTNGQVLQTDGSGNLTFTTISTAGLTNGTSNISVLENGNILLSSAGNANVLVVTGSGANVTGYITITGNITSGNANLGNLASANYFSGTLVTSAQPNITSVGTLTSLTVTGNTGTGNLSATGQISATGNISGGNISTTGNISSGNANLGNLVTANYFTGTLTTNAQPNITSVGTLTSLDITGNLSSGNANLGNLATANYIGGTLTTASQPNITSVGTLTSLSVTGNLTSGNADLGNLATANYFSGNGSLLTGLAGGNVTGQVANALVAGTVYTNAQPNITSVGTLTSLSVTGNISSGNANLGNLAIANFINVSSNLNVTDTANVGNLRTDNLLYANGQPWDLQEAAGANYQIQYNIDNDFAASANFTYNDSTQQLSLTGNLSVSGNIANANNISVTNTLSAANGTFSGNISSGNASLGNLATANYLSGTLTTAAQPNITSVGTLANLSVTGNIGTGNLSATGQISATGNISGGNIISNGAVIGNIDVGNLAVSGNILVESLTSNANITANRSFVSDNVYSRTGNLNLYAIGSNKSIVLNPTGTGTVDATDFRISNVAAPSFADDAATKQYVDNAVSSGIQIHIPVRLETNVAVSGTYAQGGTTPTVTTITSLTTLTTSSNHGLSVNDMIVFDATGSGLVGGTPYFVYSTPALNQITLSASYGGVEINTLTNGTGLSITSRANSGVGATITNSGANARLSIDSVQVNNSDRILLTGQSNSAHNGVYVVTAQGAPDSPGPGAVWVLTRATDQNKYAPQTTENMGAGDYFYVQAGNTSAGDSYVLTAPTGPIIIGTTSVTYTQFSASQVYSAGTGLTLDGTTFSISNTAVTAGNYGNGDRVAAFTVNNQGQLTAASDTVITANAANLTGTSLNASIVTSSLTSVGTLGNLSVTGNITAGNMYANSGTIGAQYLTGTLTTAAQPNITSVGTLSNLSVTGNITAGNINANISGNISAAGSNTQILFNDANLVNASSGFTFNKTSNLLTLSGNANVGNLITLGSVFAPALVQNASTYDTRIALSSSTGIIEANTNGNATQFLPNGEIRLSGAAQIVSGTSNGSQLVLGTTQTDVKQLRGGNVTVQVGTGGTTAHTWTFAQNGSLTTPGNISTNNAVNIGNTAITWDDTTTISTGANQTIATFQVTSTDITGVEFFVKGVDTVGTKYSVAKVIAVTNGTTVDYSIYGTVNLNGVTGSLAVNIVTSGPNSNIELQVTPASSNSTIWTTQYRLI